MPVGHFTSLSASGAGSMLWYTANGTWSTNTSERLIFQQTVTAVHTALPPLPSGYRTQVNFENVPLPPQPQSISWPVTPCC